MRLRRLIATSTGIYKRQNTMMHGGLRACAVPTRRWFLQRRPPYSASKQASDERRI